MIQRGFKILQRTSQLMIAKNIYKFNLIQQVYTRQTFANAMINQLKEPLFQQQEELLNVEQTIKELGTFDQLKDYVNNYQQMIQKKQENIDDLMEYYTIIFLEKLIDLESKVDNQINTQEVSKDIINTLNDLILKYLNNFSKESLLIILNLITESPVDDKRKFFRIFEFAIARTQFVQKMKEDQISSLLQNIEKIKKKGLLQQDIYIELIEKIEFAIVEQSMKDFEPADLASVAYIYSTNYQGTEALYFILKDNFKRIIKQMTLEQQVLCYWSLVNSGYFNKKPLLAKSRIDWMLQHQNELRPYYQVLFLNSYTQQKWFYEKSYFNFFKQQD